MNSPPRSSVDNTLPVHRNPNSRAVNLGDVGSVGLVTVTEREEGGLLTVGDRDEYTAPCGYISRTSDNTLAN